MKKILVFLLVLLLVFAFGCAQKVVVEQKPAPEVPAEELITEPAEEEPVPAEEPEVIIEEPEPELEEGYDWNSIPKAEQRQITQIRKAMDKALSKEENYFYRYTGPDQYQYEYWVRVNKLKMQVVEQDLLDKTTIKNVVIIDKDKDSAAWYCEHDNMNFCYSGPGPWPASVDEFYRETPVEWLAKLGQNFRYEFDDRIHGVIYNIIDYTIDDKLVRVWIDSWNGYPLQIDFHPDLDSESKPTESYKFEDLERGKVTENDVTPNI